MSAAAAPAASTAPIATTAAATAESAASATAAALQRFLHVHRATLDFASVERADGPRCLVVGRHLDEGEAARAARLPVEDDLHLGDLSGLAEHFMKVFLGDAVGKVPDVQSLSHCIPLLIVAALQVISRGTS